MKYSERDLNLIYYAIIKDDYEKIKKDYNELSIYYDTLNFIFNIYIVEIKHNDTRSSMDDLHYLIKILKYINNIRPLKTSDYDTVKLLLTITNIKYRPDKSSRCFAKLLTLIFYNNEKSDFKTADYLMSGRYSVLNTIWNSKITEEALKGLQISEKLYNFIKMCILMIKIEKDDEYVYFRRRLFAYLTVHACLINDFRYIYNYLNNQDLYNDRLRFNGYLTGDVYRDIDNMPTIYDNIPQIFDRENVIVK